MRKPDTFFDMPVRLIKLRTYPWLWIKYYWYKLVLRKRILGFCGGIPIFAPKEFEDER